MPFSPACGRGGEERLRSCIIEDREYIVNIRLIKKRNRRGNAGESPPVKNNIRSTIYCVNPAVTLPVKAYIVLHHSPGEDVDAGTKVVRIRRWLLGNDVNFLIILLVRDKNRSSKTENCI